MGCGSRESILAAWRGGCGLRRFVREELEGWVGDGR